MRYLAKAAVLTALVCAGVFEESRAADFYSLQLATFSSESAAKKFLDSLPPELRREAFIYPANGGYYTVRIWPSASLAQLKEKRHYILKNYSLPSIIVKTNPGRVKKALPQSARVSKLTGSDCLYSIQLAAFKSRRGAERFLNSLPPELRKEAFIYLTQRGYYTVRIWPSDRIAPLRVKLREIKERYGLNGFIARTKPSRLPLRSTRKLEEKKTQGASEKVHSADPGAPESGRAEITLISTGSKGFKKEIPLGKVVNKGVYAVEMNFSHLYPVEKVKDARLIVALPEDAVFVVGSSRVNGKRVKARSYNGYLLLELGQLEANRPLKVTFKLLVKKETKVEKLPYALTFTLNNGKKIVVGQQSLIEPALSGLKKVKRSAASVAAEVKRQAKFGFLFPERDIVVPSNTIEVKFAVPLSSKFSFKVNGAEVPEKYLAEKSVDKARGVITFNFVSVPLVKGENTLTLEYDGKREERKVVVSGEVARFEISLHPKRPPADGRSSAYVVIKAYDRDGNPAKVNTYIEVFVDRGDIYDYRTKTYRKFVNEPFKVRVVNGRAVVRLSPAKKPEERILKVVYGDIEREFRVRFYPEKRPWLVVGELEGSVGVSSTSGNPSKMTEMPYDHSDDGFHARGRGAIFAKGTVKDYTVTLRYDTKRPDDVLLKQNIPSTEEGQFYPVYGDSSEQYFEAKSKRHLYLRVDKELSYFLFGDYNTEFGKEFDFNRYTRTFNGVLVNLEKEKNYRIKAFGTKSAQDVLKDEFKGKGISGPYFLSARPIEFTEKVWIEIRDRYNPAVVIKRKRLNRFTDYEINYDEGFIILHEPLPEFDENFNPQYLIVTYETEELPEEEYTYGVRAEKWVKGVRFGLFGVQEEHPERDKKLYGVDAYYYQKGLKLVAELAGSRGFQGDYFEPTSGSAFRTELSYSKKGFQGRLFYKKVNDGFQNPSSTTAQDAYTNYGFNLSKSFKTFKVSAGGLVDERDQVKRKEADLTLTKKVTRKLSVEVGARYNREEQREKTENYTQGIVGLHYTPTKRVTLSLRREQSLGGERESNYFPTRTVAKAEYRWSNKTSTYLQTEVRELPDETDSLTTAGIKSQLDDNTTAYSKYTVKSGASGWRTQSHIGLNRVFRWRDDLAVDFGVENVHTFSGSGQEQDYTALRARALYTQSERYKVSGEYQVRFGEVKTEQLLRVGGVFKPTENYTVLLRDRFFVSDYRENEILLGVARRPVENDTLNFLLKLRWKVSTRDATTNKYIFSYHVNYQPARRLTLMGEYAAKFVDVKDVGTSFTDLVRGRVLYDVTDTVDFGFHAGVLRQPSTGTYTLSWGPEVGVMLFENFWVSVGYNFNGFYDDDFEGAEYWSKGPYLKFRLKFDERSLKRLKLLKKAREGERSGA